MTAGWGAFAFDKCFDSLAKVLVRNIVFFFSLEIEDVLKPQTKSQRYEEKKKKKHFCVWNFALYSQSTHNPD